jgi:ATP-dependent RNA helicase RhlE
MTNTFKDLALIDPIQRALTHEGYTEPTPIQIAAIPVVLEGKDLLATAQTGTGKTAAFALPTLQHLHQTPNPERRPRVLVLTPTRELALQIDESFRAYGRHLSYRTAVILGGVSQVPQIRALQKKPDTIVATPGRLLDLINQRRVDLSAIEVLVLDEADRMLDMGFSRDVRKIVALCPKKRQTLLFSATLTPDIARLASDMLNQPVMIEVSRSASVSGNIEQKVHFVNHSDKRALLNDILGASGVNRALVFTRTKHRADRVARQLVQSGIKADAIHSNKSQGARQRALSDFDRGRLQVLVGTDIVARGIDVDGISHVINYELPDDPENYVHRIGRTARAGADGVAVSLCALDELDSLKGIEKLTQARLTRDDDHRFHDESTASLHQKRVARQTPKKRRPYGRSNRAASSKRR